MRSFIVNIFVFIFLLNYWACCGEEKSTKVYEVEEKYFSTPQEASEAIQSILQDIKIMEMAKAEHGGYEAKYVPIEKFIIGKGILTLYYKVMVTKEGGGVIYTRPLPLHFETQNLEEVEKAKTFLLNKIKLGSGIMEPSAECPYWSFWIISYPGGSWPDITTVCTSTKENAENFYNALRSLMAASFNPIFSDKKVPQTLTFQEKQDTQEEKEKLEKPKIGFKVIPLNEDEKKKYALENGFKIIEIEKESPAEKAGLLEGDILLECNEQKVLNLKALKDLINLYENVFTILRNNEILKIKVLTPAQF